MCCYDNSEEWCCSPGEKEEEEGGREGGREGGQKGRAGQRIRGEWKGSVLLTTLPSPFFKKQHQHTGLTCGVNWNCN